MNTITRSVEQSVATVDVDDAGYVEIQVTVPLTVDEARDIAAAILKAADEGEQYLADQAERAADPAGVKANAFCSVCQAPVVRDPLSTWGFRHVTRPSGPIGHAATVSEVTR